MEDLRVPKPIKIAIYGAGAIGCYIGGCLLRAGHHVHFIGREQQRKAIQEHGLHVSDLNGRQFSISTCAFSSNDTNIDTADIVFVTVKNRDCHTAAIGIAKNLRSTSIVIGLQNGISAENVLKKAMPNNTVLMGIVAFNVIKKQEGQFHRSTEGDLILEAHPQTRGLSLAGQDTGLHICNHEDIQAARWTKLVMNLNNAINALAGIPLQQQLRDAHYRRVTAAVMSEALDVMSAAEIKACRIGKIVPQSLPFILKLPTWLFTRIAKAMLAMDAQARSSMYDDQENHRNTEIDFINGEITRLARELGLSAPINDKIVALIKAAEAKQKGSPQIAASELLPDAL